MEKVPKVAVFGLVRGYPSLFEKWRYGMLILRNLSIKIQNFKNKDHAEILVFHEGNISRPDSFWINFLSLGQVKFKDVSKTFQLPETHFHTGKIAPLGYSLMCRFHYIGLWQHLRDFDIAMRLDEDCFLLRSPKLSSHSGFSAAAFTEETHIATNETLPTYLKAIGLSDLYDHNFPYTNFYILSPKAWLEKNVQDLLRGISDQPDSIENRWGDIPVLGLALNKYPSKLGPVRVARDVSYIHLSHLSLVSGGEFKGASFVLDIKRPLRTLSSFLGRSKG